MARGSDTWRHNHWGRPCRAQLVSVQLGRAEISVDARIVPAVEALGALFRRHSYRVNPEYPEGDTGAYNCRHIGSDPDRPWSAHAWGIAIDVNWNQNPDGSRLRTDIPQACIDDIHAVRTKGGAPVWRWGGDWDRDPRTGHSYYDAMHFEIIATPAELAKGLAPLPQEDDMPTAKEIVDELLSRDLEVQETDTREPRRRPVRWFFQWIHWNSVRAREQNQDVLTAVKAVAKKVDELDARSGGSGGTEATVEAIADRVRDEWARALARDPDA